MKDKCLIFLFFLFSLSTYSLKAALFSSEDDLRIENKNWPVRISQFDLSYFKNKQETDIANIFGHHTIVDMKEDNFINYKFYLEFWELFDLTYHYQKTNISYQETGSFTLASNDFKFSDKNFGLGLQVFNVRLELGMGEYQSFNFLQTDTTQYYFFPMKDKYFYGSLETRIPTGFWVDVLLRFSTKLYRKSDNEIYKFDKGKAREWYGAVLGGPKWLKAGLYIAYGYETSKITHKFFGLNNEMGNKQHYQRVGLTLQFFP